MAFVWHGSYRRWVSRPYFQSSQIILEARYQVLRARQCRGQARQQTTQIQLAIASEWWWTHHLKTVIVRDTQRHRLLPRHKVQSELYSFYYNSTKTLSKGLPDDSGVTGIDIDIYIALKNEHNPNNVLADISEGRLKPHAIMASSSKAMMHFRVIHIKLNEHHIVRQVWMRIDGTMADLMKELGIALAQSWDIELRLGSGRYARVCQITEQELDQPLFKWGIAEEALIKVSTRFKGFKPTREEYNSDKEDDTSASEEAQI